VYWYAVCWTRQPLHCGLNWCCSELVILHCGLIGFCSVFTGGECTLYAACWSRKSLYFGLNWLPGIVTWVELLLFWTSYCIVGWIDSVLNCNCIVGWIDSVLNCNCIVGWINSELFLYCGLNWCCPEPKLNIVFLVELLQFWISNCTVLWVELILFWTVTLFWVELILFWTVIVLWVELILFWTRYCIVTGSWIASILN
jgi:hypothetical protein